MLLGIGHTGRSVRRSPCASLQRSVCTSFVRMRKMCRLFPDISSPANIWNMSDNEIDEGESISNYCTLYSKKKLSYLACGMKGRNISILIIL